MKTRKQGLDKIKGFNVVTGKLGKKYTRITGNRYFSNTYPCYENMHGSNIAMRDKNCGWYLNGKLVSTDYNYTNENGNYVWRTKNNKSK